MHLVSRETDVKGIQSIQSLLREAGPIADMAKRALLEVYDRAADLLQPPRGVALDFDDRVLMPAHK